jgi:hypothetical protein
MLVHVYNYHYGIQQAVLNYNQYNIRAMVIVDILSNEASSQPTHLITI